MLGRLELAKARGVLIRLNGSHLILNKRVIIYEDSEIGQVRGGEGLN